MDVKSLTVDPFTADSLEATRAVWKVKAEALDMPWLDYEKDLDWAAPRIDYTKTYGDSLAYGIFDADATVLALVEIVYVKRVGPDVGWLKMLTIKLSPDYAPSETDGNAVKLVEVSKIYTAAIVGTVRLTGLHQAKVIKLYGRDNTLLNLLVNVKNVLETDLDSKIFKVGLEGRWLVIGIS